MNFRKLLSGMALALGLTFGGAAKASTIPIVNLGFAIDHSGSLSLAEYQLQQQGLASALALIPTNASVQYRVSVVTFGADVKTLVAPTVVTSAADITSIQNDITSHTRSNTQATQTAAAINSLVSLFSSFMNSTTLFNISTDGQPSSQTAAVAASNAAFAAGVDGISIELVGSSLSQSVIDNNLALAGPKPAVYVTNAADLPDPTKAGFVFGVANFDDYRAAIGAKIQRIVDDTGGGSGTSPVPVPASLPLLLGAVALVGGLRMRRKAA